MNILIVEDARDQRLMLSSILKKRGYQVFEAADGVEALECLHAESDIRIVISDWIMPEMNGLELCQAIRQHDYGRYVYFILLTGKTGSESLVEGIDCGADDFVSKPVDFDEMLARLKAGVRVVELEMDLEKKNKELLRALVTIEKDLESAARTQAGLLAQPALINNVQFDWFFKPCKHLGGDMFGYQALDSDHICFYQLDVSGHGIPAALFSFTLNNLLSESGDRTLYKNHCPNALSGSSLVSPAKLLEQLNMLFQTTAEQVSYFTIVYGIMNNKTGEVVLSQAGHPNPLWMKKETQSVVAVSGSGVPIGMIPDEKYSTVSITLEPGDRLFLYSDGLTECDNNNGDQFGQDRLSQILSVLFDCSIKDMIIKIEEKIKQWNQQGVFEDDITYLVLEWNP
ncbi:MAG: SpoIIE family protein phosphatase [Candidatus Endonucleobacter sp. (ex Gigantidas childressi)]|nr:SpoIIE family protein phosphatase [Candidatus Endonucleobacter sp. (ex Gigantidas childressi)]